MQIVHYPHPALRWKSKPIVEINADLRATVRRMFDLMYESKGIGLAANQVALPYRLFVVNPTGDAAETDEEHVFINPEIIRRNGSAEGEEGCLSLPDLFGLVRRADQVVINAFDLEGREFEMGLTEMPSRVVQHETDHLDGVLFIDRLTEAARRQVEPRLAEFEAVYRGRQSSGELPPDAELERLLRALEPRGG
ncbi:MAG TPA: peptide deformylase [Planctomycetaceae bacterium]|nr:peptide deformylase [Planctomycetaceae bacterium]